MPGIYYSPAVFIVSGECKAVLTNVGLDAYAAKLAIEAKAGRKKHKTDMMQSLDKLCLRQSVSL